MKNNALGRIFRLGRKPDAAERPPEPPVFQVQTRFRPPPAPPVAKKVDAIQALQTAQTCLQKLRSLPSGDITAFPLVNEVQRLGEYTFPWLHV